MEILSITQDYIEKAIEFNEYNKKEIEEIKNIFLNNLDEHEKNIFLEIINNNDYIEKENDDIQIIDDYNPENTIKEYITISMINSNNNEDPNLNNIILFIPTINKEIKNKINEYVKNNNKEELIKYIIYGSLDKYKFVNNINDNH